MNTQGLTRDERVECGLFRCVDCAYRLCRKGSSGDRLEMVVGYLYNYFTLYTVNWLTCYLGSYTIMMCL